MGQLKDKVVWITGASSGIGRACAIELARRGVAAIALSGRRLDRLEEVAHDLGASGCRGLPLVCDVRDEQAQHEAVARVIAELGRLDIAFANAGYGVSGTVEELSAEEWRRQLDVNVVGAAITARCSIPHLGDTRGRLALTGSVAGFMTAPGYAAYHCSKHAIRALGRTLSIELHGRGVSCTTVHPGFVESEINQVRNDGTRDETRADTRPARLMWPTDRAARVIVDAIEERRRELVFTAHGKLGAWIGTHLPDLAHFVMTRQAMRRQAEAFRADS